MGVSLLFLDHRNRWQEEAYHVNIIEIVLIDFMSYRYRFIVIDGLTKSPIIVVEFEDELLPRID